MPRPGTARIVSIAARMSTWVAESSALGSGSGSWKRIVMRCTRATATRATDPYRAHPIPRRPITNPLNTDVHTRHQGGGDETPEHPFRAR